jgi:uncharacterized Zn finger protein (UPF0148 family)
MQHCEHCGQPLACFEGETYGPDCTYWHAVEQMEAATDEALAQLAIDQTEAEVMDWHSVEPPF